MDKPDIQRLRHIAYYCEAEERIWHTAIEDIPGLLAFCNEVLALEEI